MYAKSERYDGDAAAWIAIDYADFWDFPRLFHVHYRGLELVFNAPFLELADEYADHFIVHRGAAGCADWRQDHRHWKIIGLVPVQELTFDETRRRVVKAESLAAIFARYDWT